VLTEEDTQFIIENQNDYYLGETKMNVIEERKETDFIEGDADILEQTTNETQKEAL